MSAPLVAVLLASAVSRAQASGLQDPFIGIEETSFWAANQGWLLPVIVVVALALVGLAAWLIMRKRPQRVLSPAEEARLLLGEAADLAGAQDDKSFSVTVSDALRVYLERRYALRAPEQTTEEFLQSAGDSHRLPEQSLKTLAEFLELCDLAKFAQHAFGDDERQRLLATARAFVDEAERRQQPEPKEAAAV